MESCCQRTAQDSKLFLKWSAVQGLDNDDVVQTPTLPESAIKPKKSLIAIGAAIASGFLLLVFVFARQALRSAQEASPEQAEKIARIRKALPW